MGNLLEELKRRRVYRVSAIYAVVAWSLIQFTDVILPTFNAPQWLNQAIIIGLLAGFPLIAIMAWMFEFTSGGLQKIRSVSSSENTVMRKRDYFSAALITVLVVLVIGQQVALLTRPQSEQPLVIIESVDLNSEIIGQILRLTDDRDYVQAFTLAQELESQQSDNQALTELWQNFSRRGTILTQPEGAEVWVKDSALPDSEWIHLGTSPLQDIRLPLGSLRINFEKESFVNKEMLTENPFIRFGNYPFRPGIGPIPFVLDAIDGPQDMISVPAIDFPLGVAGFGTEEVFFGPYHMDKFEVSNEQFKEFVDQGGYENKEYWEGLEFVDGETQLSLAQAMNRFVDTTGRPGPASWELGGFLPDTENYPVTGVSWYEAVAYARFRGKELPTAYHWVRAAFLSGFLSSPTISVSNFSGSPIPVDSMRSVGPMGTYNMRGNAREWAWNTQGNNRWVLGGAWNDPNYMNRLSYNLPPFTRDEVTGFRLAQYIDESSIRDELLQPPNVNPIDFRNAAPVSNEIYNAMEQQFSFSSNNLSPVTEYTDDTNQNWVEEKVLLNTDYDDERFSVYVITPKTPGPHAAVIFFPGLNSFSDEAAVQKLEGSDFDFIINSGRALIFPTFDGSFERYDGFDEMPAEEKDRGYRDHILNWHSDMGRTLDYLESREDIDNNSFAYLGASYGASTATPLIALEPRLKVAVLVIGGFSFRIYPLISDPLTYVSRITQPVLMLSGRFDNVFPLETRATPFFEMLGTSEQDKKHVMFNGGHRPPPRNIFVTEVVDWLDKYQK